MAYNQIGPIVSIFSCPISPLASQMYLMLSHFSHSSPSTQMRRRPSRPGEVRPRTPEEGQTREGASVQHEGTIGRVPGRGVRTLPAVPHGDHPHRGVPLAVAARPLDGRREARGLRFCCSAVPLHITVVVVSRSRESLEKQWKRRRGDSRRPLCVTIEWP